MVKWLVEAVTTMYDYERTNMELVQNFEFELEFTGVQFSVHQSL